MLLARSKEHLHELKGATLQTETTGIQLEQFRRLFLPNQRLHHLHRVEQRCNIYNQLRCAKSGLRLAASFDGQLRAESFGMQVLQTGGFI